MINVKSYEQLQNKTATAFGIALMRDGVIGNILGDEESTIMYWAGKDLAKQFKIPTLLGIQDFFKNSSLGDLQIISQSEGKQIWTLTGNVIENRFISSNKPDFHFEAGFLAQQLEQTIKTISETQITDISKTKIKFTVISDLSIPEGTDNKDASFFREGILNSSVKHDIEEEKETKNEEPSTITLGQLNNDLLIEDNSNDESNQNKKNDDNEESKSNSFARNISAFFNKKPEIKSDEKVANIPLENQNNSISNSENNKEENVTTVKPSKPLRSPQEIQLTNKTVTDYAVEDKEIDENSFNNTISNENNITSSTTLSEDILSATDPFNTPTIMADDYENIDDSNSQSIYSKDKSESPFS